MWFIVGYDPIWIGSIRTVYVQGRIDFFDKNQNTITIEVKKNIHKGNPPLSNNLINGSYKS